LYKSASDLSTTAPFGTPYVVYGMAADGTSSPSSNIWVGVGGSGSKNVYEFASTGTLSNTYNESSTFSGLMPHTSAYSFDSNDNLWLNTGTTTLKTYAITAGAVSGSYGTVTKGTLTAGAGGNMYGCNSSGTGISVFNQSTSPSAATTTYAPTSFQGCSGAGMSVDGLGNIWTSNSSNTFLQELNSSGTLLSPSTGYTGTSSSESTTLRGNLSGLAIDGSGNLWVANANTGSSGSTAYNALVEYVGAAAPVTTPLSLAINYSEVGVRP